MLSFGKFLAIAGLVLATVGGLLMFTDRTSFLARLLGDIYVKRENVE